ARSCLQSDLALPALRCCPTRRSSDLRLGSRRANIGDLLPRSHEIRQLRSPEPDRIEQRVGPVLRLHVEKAHRIGRRRRSDPLARSEGTRLNSSHVEISYAVFCLKKTK